MWCFLVREFLAHSRARSRWPLKFSTALKDEVSTGRPIIVVVRSLIPTLDRGAIHNFRTLIYRAMLSHAAVQTGSGTDETNDTGRLAMTSDIVQQFDQEMRFGAENFRETVRSADEVLRWLRTPWLNHGRTLSFKEGDIRHGMNAEQLEGYFVDASSPARAAFAEDRVRAAAAAAASERACRRSARWDQFSLLLLLVFKALLVWWIMQLSPSDQRRVIDALPRQTPYGTNQFYQDDY